jgi:signal transduction histidine kinase
MRLPIRWKLTGLFIVIFGASILTTNLIVFHLRSTNLQEEFDDALFNYTVDVFNSISLDAQGDLNVNPLQFDRNKIYPFTLGTALIQVRNEHGSVLEQIGDFGNYSFPYMEVFHEIHQGKEAFYQTLDNVKDLPDPEADSYRLVSIPLDTGPKSRLILQVAVPRTLLENQLHSYRQLLLGGIPFILLIASISGIFLTGRAMRPVADLTMLAQKISPTHLSERILVPDAQDEIRDLALTFNQMLDRIHKAFESQERFIADASHQLMTPLTTMRSAIEIEMIKSPDSKWLRSQLQEVDHLVHIVKDMLLLARADAGMTPLNLELVVVNEVVTESIRRCQDLAYQKNIKLDLQILMPEDQLEFPTVKAERELLVQGIRNLIENAIKYSSENTNVRIEISQDYHHIQIRIKDQGPGIPPQDLEKIFERFSRSSNASKTQGFGLGLAISWQIVKMHQGHLSIPSTSEQGTCFEIELPRSV